MLAETIKSNVAYHLAVPADIEIHSVGFNIDLCGSVIRIFVVNADGYYLAVTVILFLNGSKHIVVAVHYKGSFLVRAFKNFKLCFKNSLPRAEVLDMGISNICYNAYVWVGSP